MKFRDVAEERMHLALQVIANSYSAEAREDVQAVAQTALEEWAAWQERIGGPPAPCWYCANCQKWVQAFLEGGDLLCDCGHVIASYRATPPEATP